jgi:hypothetical protein
MIRPTTLYAATLALIGGGTQTRTTPSTVSVVFNVPVKISAMDTTETRVQVTCWTDWPTRFVENDPPQNLIAVSAGSPHAHVEVPLVSGAYTGTVQVPVSISVQNVGESWQYRCKLRLYDSSVLWWTPTLRPGQTDSRLKTGGPLQTEMSGIYVIGS